MAVEHISKDAFENEVLGAESPVLVDFYATWCGPCKMLAPILDEVSEESDKVKIVKVDIDENMDIAEKYGIMSIPTLIVFKEGQEIAREVGFRQKTQILEIIENI
ncbi:MAG: thioredoxin [Clostridia bacterium]|nr:thioredoxin [Clostridia bacterium]